MLGVREGSILERDDRLQIRDPQRSNIWRKREGQDILDAVLPALVLLLSSLGAQGPLQVGELVVNNIVGVIDGAVGLGIRVVDVAVERTLIYRLVWGRHGG